MEKTTQEKFNELKDQVSRLMGDTGILQYNIQDYQAQLAEKNIKICNGIKDLNKLQEKLNKEAKEQAPATDPAPVVEETKAEEPVNVAS